MQPASSSGARDSGGGRGLKRWGPIVGVLAVLAIGAGVLVATSGGDDDDDGEAEATTTAAATTTPTGTDEVEDSTTVAGSGPATTAPTATSAPTSGPAEITYPLSFAQAQEQGLDVDFGERCDATTGVIAVPDFFAPECYLPFEGDNGGATAPGVTAEEITVVAYIGQANDPIIAYITDAIDVDDTNEEIAATYQEQWVHRVGDVNDPQHRAARWRYRCCFTPDDREWERTALDGGRRLLDQAISAVAAWA